MTAPNQPENARLPQLDPLARLAHDIKGVTNNLYGYTRLVRDELSPEMLNAPIFQLSSGQTYTLNDYLTLCQACAVDITERVNSAVSQLNAEPTDADSVTSG